ncbi:WecB/TagA/CpsF family glycosyltransferase [Hahella ganghwensis]|uniref:WecB/TagA/CpsF family glycosyltransferase n=1 Tax=Hahella ganghwensis TaxID=286420 RepID=UPI00037BAF57|nr:WecB/TagA/CpsF family glycosyltransferase [Hahella ganghwensis]
MGVYEQRTLDVELPSISPFGTTMHPITLQQTIDLIEQRIHANRFTQHVVVNVAKLVNMAKDDQLRKSIECCDIVNIDGMGVVWGARLLGYDVPERVAGIDLFIFLVEMAAERSIPIYLLGAKQAVVEEVALALQRQYAKLKVAGFHHGYFGEDEEEVVSNIRNSGAKMLFVAISSPKKEIFINKWKVSLGVDFVMGVGGSFDVIAGKVKRAPLWMQRSGLEWFYRMLQEPRRMTRRYLKTNMAFIIMLIKEKIWK